MACIANHKAFLLRNKKQTPGKGAGLKRHTPQTPEGAQKPATALKHTYLTDPASLQEGALKLNYIKHHVPRQTQVLCFFLGLYKYSSLYARTGWSETPRSQLLQQTIKQHQKSSRLARTGLHANAGVLSGQSDPPRNPHQPPASCL